MAQENQETTVLGENLDGNQQEQSQPSEVDNATDQDYLAELVGEGKKYSSVEDAAKALAKKAAHADQFIETIKTEKKTVEDELNRLRVEAKTAEDVLKLLEERSKAPQEPKQPGVPQQPENIETVVQQVLKQREAEAKKKANVDTSWAKLSEVYGSKESAKRVVAEYLSQNPERRMVIDTLGATDPGELVRIISSFKKAEVHNPSEDNSVRLPSETQSKPPLSWVDVQKIRKEDPKLYHSAKFQAMLHKLVSENPNFLPKK